MRVNYIELVLVASCSFPCAHSVYSRKKAKPRVGLDSQKRNRSGLCMKPPDLRSVVDITLNPSLRKSKRE